MVAMLLGNWMTGISGVGEREGVAVGVDFDAVHPPVNANGMIAIRPINTFFHN